MVDPRPFLPRIRPRMWGNSQPMVLHANGFKFREWRGLRKALFQRVPQGRLECPADLEIITWSTYSRPTTIERCCEHFKVPLRVLRMPQSDWLPMLKIKMAWQAALECDKAYMMGLDASDVLLLGSPADILNRFHHLQPLRLLYCAEMHIHPRRVRALRPITLRERRSAKSAREMPFCYLNAGCWIGETSAVRELYGKWWAAVEAGDLPAPLGNQGPKACSSEQGIIRWFYLKEAGIAIDRRCELFQSTYIPVNLRGKFKSNINISWPDDATKQVHCESAGDAGKAGGDEGK